MKIKFIICISALLAVTMSAACSQVPAPSHALPSAIDNKIVSGSYIVNAAADGELVIRRVFAEYGVALLRSLGNGQFELRLNQDPGLEVAKNKVAGTNGAISAIQPNFVYHSY